MRCSAEIWVIAHATEDLDVIISTLKSAFGDLPYIIEPLVGHYGNPIYLISAFTEDCGELLRKLCQELGGELGSLQPSPAREYFIRLDKQRLARGGLAASNSDDVVKIRVRAERLCG